MQEDDSMSGISEKIRSYRPWEMLTQTLGGVQAFDRGQAQTEPCACFRIGAEDIGGPQGDLPITAAIFVIHPPAAKLLDELADRLKEAGAKFRITIAPSHLGITWDLTDQEVPSNNRASDTAADIVWCPNPEDIATVFEKSFGHISSIPGVSDFEIAVTPEGEVWFHVDMDGPSTADVPIPRAILQEIAAGYSETPSPSM
jgi:hypothetical protein